MSNASTHFSVLKEEVLFWAPSHLVSLLDVTAGGGGHLTALLEKFPAASATAWDRDPRAIERVAHRLKELGASERVCLKQQSFSHPEESGHCHSLILADLGVSSFQFNPELSGMSLYSELKPDFRMNPQQGTSFADWLKTQTESDLAAIFYKFAEEPKASKLAHEFMKIAPSDLGTARQLAHWIRLKLGYRDSKIHPATRIFQAFRMAINQELEELKALLSWSPEALEVGGRLLVISFHSIEDRLVKRTFLELQKSGAYKVLTKRPVVPSDLELDTNPASRSAKLRVIERVF